MIDRVLEGPGQQLPLEVDRDEPRARIDVLEAGHGREPGGGNQTAHRRARRCLTRPHDCGRRYFIAHCTQAFSTASLASFKIDGSYRGRHMMLHSRVACYSLVMLATIATRSAAQARPALQPVSGALSARLDSIIDEFRNEQQLPGISIAVVTSNGRLLYGHGFGFADVSAHRPVTNRTLVPIY